MSIVLFPKCLFNNSLAYFKVFQSYEITQCFYNAFVRNEDLIRLAKHLASSVKLLFLV